MAAAIPGLPTELVSWLVALAAVAICIDRIARMATAPHFVTFARQLRRAARAFSKWSEANLRYPDHSPPPRSTLIFVGFVFTVLCYLFVFTLLAQGIAVAIGLATKQVPLIVFVIALLLLWLQFGGARYYCVQAYRGREKLHAIVAGTWLGKQIF